MVASFDPSQFETVINVIATSFQAINGIFSVSNHFKQQDTRTRGVEQLSQLKEALVSFAEMHYALGEWKDLHDRTHQMMLMLRDVKNHREFSTETALHEFSEIWTMFRSVSAEPMIRHSGRYEYIPTVLEIDSLGIAPRQIHWLTELRSYIVGIDDALKVGLGGRGVVAAKVPELNAFVDVLISAANENLIGLAGELARHSRELTGRLQS